MHLRSWGLVSAALLLSGCTTLVGDHPFSSAPRSSGKLDKTPEVFIQRGQSPQVCRENEKDFHLYYFIHLRWMPYQKVWVERADGSEVELFGKDFTIKVKARASAGKWTWYQTKFRTEKQSFSVTTLVMDCIRPTTEWSDASVEASLSTSATASSSAGAAGGF